MLIGRSSDVPASGRLRSLLGVRRVGLQAKVLPYVLIAPLLILIVVLVLYPLAATTVQAFFGASSLGASSRFVGLGNFIRLLSNAQIVESLENTGLYTVIGVVLTTTLGVVAALALRSNFPGRGAVLAAVILPWAISGFVEAVIWNWIYNPNFGVLNSILYSLHIISHYHIWIGQNRILSIFLIELVQVWQTVPLAALIVLASLQMIPSEVIESATVDGCRGFRMFVLITLPLIRSGIAIASVGALVSSVYIFDQVYALNYNAPLASSGMSQVYLITFAELDFNGGYALSILLAVAGGVMTLALLRAVYRKIEY